MLQKIQFTLSNSQRPVNFHTILKCNNFQFMMLLQQDIAMMMTPFVSQSSAQEKEHLALKPMHLSSDTHITQFTQALQMSLQPDSIYHCFQPRLIQ